MTMRGAVTFLLMGAALALSASVSTPAAAQGQPLVFLGPCGEFGYKPVCARARGDILVTYANACIARSEGSRVISQGPCPIVCPMIYKPVCTIDAAGNRKTYGNDCQAKASGATVIRSGRCLR